MYHTVESIIGGRKKIIMMGGVLLAETARQQCVNFKYGMVKNCGSCCDEQYRPAHLPQK